MLMRLACSSVGWYIEAKQKTKRQIPWIPACAGMTTKSPNDDDLEKARAAREPPLRKRKSCLPPGFTPAFARNSSSPSEPALSYRAHSAGKDFLRIGWDWTGRRGDFLMESGVCEKMEAANLLSAPGILLSPIGRFFILQLEWILTPCPSLTEAAGAVAPAGSGKQVIMKIIIFSIKLDKFTGFFHKFPKIVSPATACNLKGYHINLSVPHSDPAAKKVFWFPRICPQLPAFPLLPG